MVLEQAQCGQAVVTQAQSQHLRVAFGAIELPHGIHSVPALPFTPTHGAVAGEEFAFSLGFLGLLGCLNFPQPWKHDSEQLFEPRFPSVRLCQIIF